MGYENDVASCLSGSWVWKEQFLFYFIIVIYFFIDIWKSPRLQQMNKRQRHFFCKINMCKSIKNCRCILGKTNFSKIQFWLFQYSNPYSIYDIFKPIMHAFFNTQKWIPLYLSIITKSVIYIFQDYKTQHAFMLSPCFPLKCRVANNYFRAHVNFFPAAERDFYFFLFPSNLNNHFVASCNKFTDIKKYFFNLRIHSEATHQ